MEAPDFVNIPYIINEWFYDCDQNACQGIELSYIFGSFKNYEILFPELGELVVPDDVLALRTDYNFIITLVGVYKAEQIGFYNAELGQVTDKVTLSCYAAKNNVYNTNHDFIVKKMDVYNANVMENSPKTFAKSVHIRRT